METIQFSCPGKFFSLWSPGSPVISAAVNREERSSLGRWALAGVLAEAAVAAVLTPKCTLFAIDEYTLSVPWKTVELFWEDRRQRARKAFLVSAAQCFCSASLFSSESTIVLIIHRVHFVETWTQECLK